jgi:hypothetical protein
MKNRYILPLAGALAGALCLLSPLSGEEVLLLQESFETEGAGTRYEVFGDGDDLGTSVFARRKEGTPGTRAEGGTLDGEWMWAAMDIDGAPGPRGDTFEGEDMLNVQGRLRFSNIDVSGMGNIRVAIAAATGLGMPEPSDDMYVRARFDGGEWVELGGFKSSSSNTRPAYYVGPKDTLVTAQNPNKLFRFFSDWSWEIVGKGSTMDLDITIASNFHNDDHFYDNIRVYGEAGVRFFDAQFQDTEVVEPAEGGVPNPLTLTLTEPAPEGGLVVRFSGSFETMSSLGIPQEPAVQENGFVGAFIPAGETSTVVPVEVVQDGRYTGTKTVDLYISADGFNTELARIQLENVTPFPENLVIMEAMNVVPGTQPQHLFGDANGDGRYHNTMDQFIEIVNFEDYPVDLSGWKIGDDLADRHLIPEGTILYPNTALVVFGGTIDGKAPRGTFGGAIVQTSTAGGNGLGYNITSRAERTYITAPFDALVDLVHMPLLRADHLAVTDNLPEGHAGKGVSASVHRLTAEKGEIGYVLDSDHIHSILSGAGERLFSPGTWYTGAPYFDPENEITLTLSAESVSEADGFQAATGFIQLAQPAPAGGIEITIETDGVVIHPDGSFSPDEISLDALELTIPEGQDSASFRIGAHNDGVLDGDQETLIYARSGPYVLPGFVSLLVEDVDQAGDLDVVVNEVFIDVAGSAADFNLDGQFEDPLGDQFIELVNNSGRPVNLSGWRVVWDSGDTYALTRDVHAFPPGTWLPDGGAIVVFGKVSAAAAADPVFGGAIVQGALEPDGNIKNDGLGLVLTTSHFIRLQNPHGYTVHEVYVVASMAQQDMSLTREPDITGAELALHLDAHLAAGGFEFLIASPGLQLDGVPFPGNGVALLPDVFVQAHTLTPQGWWLDPVFGWLAASMEMPFDMPWLYSTGQGTFLYVPDMSKGGSDIWMYDPGSGWLYTNYTVYPFMWDYASGSWVR